MIEFDWDDANVEHLAYHGVTPAEFEQAMSIDPDDIGFEVINSEERYYAVGPASTGRLLFLVWTMRGEHFRAVTAYDAPSTLRRAWEERRG